MPGFWNRPWAQSLSWGRLEILQDRREALPCWHCHEIEPSAKPSKDCFSCIDHSQSAPISLKLFAFIIFIFMLFIEIIFILFLYLFLFFKTEIQRIVLFISYLRRECPDCLPLSLRARKFYRFAKHLDIAASNSWFGRRGERGKEFLVSI